MEPILQWGLRVIDAVQAIRSPAMDTAFEAITEFGSANFYIAALIAFCWIADPRLGAKIAAVIAVSVLVNYGLKHMLHEPRPFLLNPSVAVISESGYSLPSGHAQHSLLFWGLIGAYFQRKSVWIFGTILVMLIGLSRVYLGVHFPTDILVGWLVGGAILSTTLFYVTNRVARPTGQAHRAESLEQPSSLASTDQGSVSKPPPQ